MTLITRPATEADVAFIAPRLRPADLLEIGASVKADPYDALLRGLHSPDGCFVAETAAGVPVLIGGTSPSDSPLLGYVWMMGTQEVETHWLRVLRNTQSWIQQFKGDYQLLANAVHEGNTLHMRWLKWAGFSFLRRFTYRGHGFYEFAKIV